MMWHVALLSLAFGVGLVAGQLSDTFTDWLDHPAIQYAARPVSDPVAELNRKLREGTIQLTFDGPSGYLKSVLNALDVPVESQIAVFLKDSVQATRISPGNPRTIFFNDSVAVGWVRGGFIELASQDPQQGVVFYSLSQDLLNRAQAFVTPPQFVRHHECTTCHFNYSTMGVPGMLARSVGQFAVDHRTPIEQRWGGWYVARSGIWETPIPHRSSMLRRRSAHSTGHHSTASSTGLDISRPRATSRRSWCSSTRCT